MLGAVEKVRCVSCTCDIFPATKKIYVHHIAGHVFARSAVAFAHRGNTELQIDGEREPYDHILRWDQVQHLFGKKCGSIENALKINQRIKEPQEVRNRFIFNHGHRVTYT